MLSKLSLVTLTLGLICISESHGSVDRVVDRMMEKIFIDSARMSKNILNAPLPNGFWASNRLNNYPVYSNNGMRRYGGQRQPVGTRISTNIYAPRYSINRSIKLPSMPRFSDPMATKNMIPPMFKRFFMKPRSSRPNSLTYIRGPGLQVNLKLKAPVNKKYNKIYKRRDNYTKSFDRESVGEFVATWNTEMKEIMVSGIKNETKIKTFKNNGNIHSHLGSGSDGEVGKSRVWNVKTKKEQNVPRSINNNDDIKPISSVNNNKQQGDQKDTMKYKLDQDQSSMPQPTINLLPRRQQRQPLIHTL